MTRKTQGEKANIVLENFPFASAVGTPALFGLAGLFITASIFRRPYIAIAGAILGVLLGMGMSLG